MNDRVAILGYRIVRPLATGGMGAVFEVEKLATRQRFAAKFLHEHLATEREYRLRFEREVGALCAVRHPHIVNIFGWRLPALGESGKPYILMELLHGEGVDQLLAREVALAPRRAIGILLQALDGLAAAHTAGVIHRDLGPSNVFLTVQPHSDPLVKLLDFGLAGPVGGGEARANVTQAGTVMGKPAYVAPEMFEGRPIDSRSDIFACGVLLFRMIAGRLPYREQDSSLLWMERYSERREPREYPALRDYLANVPDVLDEACARAMRRNPDHRFRSAREMQLALLDVDTELARLAGETSESNLSWADASPADAAASGGAGSPPSTVAFPLSPDLDQPLKPKGDATPLPVIADRPAALRHPTAPDGRSLPIIIDPKKPARREPVSTAANTWEVVPAERPAAPPERKAERSGSSVVARSVPAGGRSFVLRPAVLAAAVVLLALTVALVVLFTRPGDAGGGAASPTGLVRVEGPAAAADRDPPAPATPPEVRGPEPAAPLAPDASAAVPVPPPPATPPAAPADAAPSAPADAVAIVLLGLPPGATASLGGVPFAGQPLRIELPASSTPQLLHVAAPGFKVYESRIAPTADSSISIPLVPVDGVPIAAPPPDAGTPPADAGRRIRPPSGPRNPREPPGPRPPTTTGPGIPLPETPPG
ncbi:MAG: serine/threonine protein kinase [Deltaproteobacteria bacterium]|nr:serine/threonine protein kinase [Deltaproteobacteria bacterium]